MMRKMDSRALPICCSPHSVPRGSPTYLPQAAKAIKTQRDNIALWWAAIRDLTEIDRLILPSDGTDHRVATTRTARRDPLPPNVSAQNGHCEMIQIQAFILTMPLPPLHLHLVTSTAAASPAIVAETFFQAKLIPIYAPGSLHRMETLLF